MGKTKLRKVLISKPITSYLSQCKYSNNFLNKEIMSTQVLPTRINVNQFGIPTISSNSISVGTTQVAFDFNNHPTVGQPFRGLVIIRLNQSIPEGSTTTLPIVFTSDSSNVVNLIGFNGENVTVADIPGTGIYLVFVDSQSNTVQLLTGIV